MIRRAMAPLARQVANLLSRGTVTLVNAAGKLQTLQLSLLADEAKDGVEHFEPFGLSAKAMVGAEALAAFIDGDRSNGVVVVVTDRRYRPQNLADGETVLFNAHGATILLSKNGIVINANGKPVTVDSSGVTLNSNLQVNGNINASGTVHGSNIP